MATNCCVVDTPTLTQGGYTATVPEAASIADAPALARTHNIATLGSARKPARDASGRDFARVSTRLVLATVFNSMLCILSPWSGFESFFDRFLLSQNPLLISHYY